MATVRIPTQLRSLVDNASELTVDGATVGDVLTALDAAHPGFGERLFDENGKLQTFADFYGLDGRTSAALTGKAMRMDSPPVPQDDDVTAAADPDPDPDSSQRKPGSRKKQPGGPPTLADAISGLFSP